MSEITPSPLHISCISIRLDDASRKKVDFVELEFDSLRQEIRRQSGEDKDLSKDFDPAIAVTTERVSLFVHCRHRTVIPRKISVEFPLSKEEILSNAVDHDGQREYRTTKRKVTVVITIYSDVLQICPRFRLLVIGKTGVGKSSLIQQAFGINDVHVSEYRRGEADIDKEFIAPENQRFVLHDSEGFEAGDSDSLIAAKDFIDRRRKMPNLQDKIHAVWLCLSIPHGDGSLLERGVEELLKSRKEILRNIPIIVVFTKLDELVDDLEYNAKNSGEYDEAALERLKTNTLNELCIQPLKEVAGTDILHIAVSKEESYESTIRQLIDLTTTNVEKFVNPDAALAMMIAQRAHIGLKVKASIAIIKKRYWRGIAVGMNFIGFTMLDCFSKIHEDIIGVWNLYDPDCHLVSEKFKNPIVNDLDRNLPHTGGAVGLDLVTKIMAFLEPLAHADPTGVFSTVVMAVSTAVIVVGWAYETYQQTNDASQRIMTYIVDLTWIMQILFLLCSRPPPPPGSSPPPGLIPPGPISLPAIKIVIDAYEEAGKTAIHSEVKSRVSVAHARGDDALDKIDQLIKRHSIKDEQVQELRQQLSF